MRDILQPDELEKRRDQYIDRFCKDLMDALFFPKSEQDVISGIDTIVEKLKRLIHSQSKENNQEFQRKIFFDICKFLNALNGNFEVRKFHNCISKTNLDDYKNMSLGEQFYNNAYLDKRNFVYDCKGGSCSNWTLSLYRFFDALKKAGLDIELSIYRLKNTDDDFVGIVSMRHSGLVIHFQGFDYMIDYEGINDVFSGCLIQPVDTLKRTIAKFGINDTDNLNALKKRNRKRYNSRANKDGMLVHFNNEKDFLDDVKKYPELKKISFITHELKGGEPTRLDYKFFKGGVYIEVDDYQRDFVLKQDAHISKDKNEFLNSLVENIEYIKDQYGMKDFTQADKEELSMLLGMIQNDINLDYVMSEYK